METIVKLLELVSFKKEQWITILIAIIISGATGGWFYINALQTRIFSLEIMLAEKKEDLKEQRERHKSTVTDYKIIFEEKYSLLFDKITGLEFDKAEKIRKLISNKKTIYK
ncbi:MAG: hypothetical protein GY797_36470 [Deltaproteobacteria bacterium]|nr:hypothetical protein [Deltaproteobacteria bacterium]